MPADGTVDERLDFADRWLRDGLRVLRADLAVMQVSVDMTAAARRLTVWRRAGVLASPTHLVVHAVARTLRQHPALHQIVAGNTRQRPSQIDIGLSITGEAIVVPVLVIERADQKSVEEVAAEVERRTPEAQQADARMLRALRRFGWLLPVGVFRRSLMRLLFRSPAFRKKGVGTFQVSSIPAEWGFTSSFATAGVLFVGQLASRVVAVDGEPAVRPMIKLTLSGDHGVWNGRDAALFLAEVKRRLESDDGK